MYCELPQSNPDDSEIKKILKETRTIAVVGLSDDETKDSYRVAKYMLDHGYKIIPVNPKYFEILNQKCYENLSAIPEKIDMVNIFRKPEAVFPIVEEAVKIGAKVIWMQLGICNNEAAEIAREKGLKVIMNKCLKVEHSTYNK